MSRGRHYIIDCRGLPFRLCVDDKKLLEILIDAAVAAGCNIVSTSRYRFGFTSPPGCTVFVMLDESHLSLHTYAEDGNMAIDIFTCGDKVDGESIFRSLKEKLEIREYDLHIVERFRNG